MMKVREKNPFGRKGGGIYDLTSLSVPPLQHSFSLAETSLFLIIALLLAVRKFGRKEMR